MENFKRGDKVRVLKDVKRDSFRKTEHYFGDIIEIAGVGEDGDVIWFKIDGNGNFPIKYFELYETKEGLKPKPKEPTYEIY